MKTILCSFFLSVYLLVSNGMVYGQVQVGGNKSLICVGGTFDKSTRKSISNLLEVFYNKTDKTFGRLSSKELSVSKEKKLFEEISTLNTKECESNFPITYNLLLSLSKQPIEIDKYPKQDDEYIGNALKKVEAALQKNWLVGDCAVLESLNIAPKIKIGEKVSSEFKNNIIKEITILKNKITRKK